MLRSKKKPRVKASEIARKAFRFDLERLWFDEFVTEHGHCGLCANSGVIDTFGSGLRTHAGAPVGIRAFCICPNGRAMKDQGGDLEASADGTGHRGMAKHVFTWMTSAVSSVGHCLHCGHVPGHPIHDVGP